MAADIRTRTCLAGSLAGAVLAGAVLAGAVLAGAVLAVAMTWALHRRPSRAAGESAQGSIPAGPRPVRVTVTDAQVEAARMLVEHDRALGRETAAPVRRIAEATPVPGHTKRASRHR
jgi:hypothetical protein